MRTKVSPLLAVGGEHDLRMIKIWTLRNSWRLPRTFRRSLTIANIQAQFWAPSAIISIAS